MSREAELATSVRARLLNLARKGKEDFQLVLLRYGNERLLYRLSTSPHGHHFVLKGASLFTLWTGKSHRATKDLDLLGPAAADLASLRQIFSDLLFANSLEDGLLFDPKSFSVAPIREDQPYGGTRILVTAMLEKTRIRMQIDVGLGDAVTPTPTIVEFPTLLDHPAPRLLAYAKETVVAEKLHAMVERGMANSRMKDFFDIGEIAQLFHFEGYVLVRAIRATFSSRGTVIPTEEPVAFTSEFFEDSSKQAQWTGFLRKAGLADCRKSLADAVRDVKQFCWSPLAAAGKGAPWKKRWTSLTQWTE